MQRPASRRGEWCVGSFSVYSLLGNNGMGSNAPHAELLVAGWMALSPADMTSTDVGFQAY